MKFCKNHQDRPAWARGLCNSCVAKSRRERLKKLPEYREAEKLRSRKYYLKNQKLVAKRTRAYQLKDKDKWRAWKRRYEKEREMVDIGFRIRRRLSTRLHRLVKGLQKDQGCLFLLGCSLPDFLIYLESKFEVGMSWENYGRVWHIDHIMPCAVFDLTKPEHQGRCFHFSNLQPLFAKENLRKHAKVISAQFNLL